MKNNFVFISTFHFEFKLEIRVSMGFTERMVKQEIQGLRDFQARVANLGFMALSVRKEHLELMARRERVELREAQDRQDHLVLQVIVLVFFSFLFQFVQLCFSKSKFKGTPGIPGEPGEPGEGGVPGVPGIPGIPAGR